jgi:NAD(P)-dependent dehydrogenase (short-subunit alcohol dehydrogenase family)
MEHRFAGRTALVTGGASGIGSATVRRLAAEGARVAVADIDEVAAKEVADDVDGLAVGLDVTDLTAVQEAIPTIEADLGPLDVLVNNAGGDRFVFFLESTEEDWDRALLVNLRSVIGVTHTVLGGMCARRSGSVVNVASEAGRLGTVAGPLYSAAKGGVLAFTKAVARECLGDGVRVNVVAPGPVDTPLLAGAVADHPFGAAIRQGMIDATLLGRTAEPDEVAAAVAYLASDDASFTTGLTLSVSGALGMS